MPISWQFRDTYKIEVTKVLRKYKFPALLKTNEKYILKWIYRLKMLKRTTRQLRKYFFKARVCLYQMFLCVVKGEREHSRNHNRVIAILDYRQGDGDDC